MIEEFVNEIYEGDVINVLEAFPDECINCCVTSPPYFGLRDYGVNGQLGLEPSPEEYINKMVEVFSEVKRVLKNDGTLWLNIGDSYVNNNKKLGDHKGQRLDRDMSAMHFDRSNIKYGELKQKDLIGIPWMLAFALRANGWYLRQDIIWHKPNPMPESVTDRCSRAHEYIFLLSKTSKYYFNNEAIKQSLSKSTKERVLKTPATFGGAKGREYTPDKNDPNFRNGSEQWGREYIINPEGKANKRSVWTVTTKPFKEAHFATFPTDLIEPCILAGCPDGGIVLDPFMGAGTTALVSKRLGRKYLGAELNPEYIKIANARLLKG